MGATAYYSTAFCASATNPSVCGKRKLRCHVMPRFLCILGVSLDFIWNRRENACALFKGSGPLANYLQTSGSSVALCISAAHVPASPFISWLEIRNKRGAVSVHLRGLVVTAGRAMSLSVADTVLSAPPAVNCLPAAMRPETRNLDSGRNLGRRVR
jgi:hypothetical protein